MSSAENAQNVSSEVKTPTDLENFEEVKPTDEPPAKRQKQSTPNNKKPLRKTPKKDAAKPNGVRRRPLKRQPTPPPPPPPPPSPPRPPPTLVSQAVASKIRETHQFIANKEERETIILNNEGITNTSESALGVILFSKVTYYVS